MLTNFALENVKLIMLFALIGTVIGLSHLNEKNLARFKTVLVGKLRRAIGAYSKSPSAVH